MNNSDLQSLALVAELVDPLYAKREQRHRCMLQCDTSICSCPSPRFPEVSLQQFTDHIFDRLVRLHDFSRSQLTCFVFGPVRYSTSSMPNFDYIAYSGDPMKPRPDPSVLIGKESAIRNILGTDEERFISSKRLELEKPDSPFNPNEIDETWGLEGSAYYTGAEMSNFVRLSVSPPHFVFGIEGYGALFEEYVRTDVFKAYVSAIGPVFREEVMMYATCCQGYKPTCHDPSIC